MSTSISIHDVTNFHVNHQHQDTCEAMTIQLRDRAGQWFDITIFCPPDTDIKGELVKAIVNSKEQ